MIVNLFSGLWFYLNIKCWLTNYAWIYIDLKIKYWFIGCACVRVDSIDHLICDFNEVHEENLKFLRKQLGIWIHKENKQKIRIKT